MYFHCHVAWLTSFLFYIEIQVLVCRWFIAYKVADFTECDPEKMSDVWCSYKTLCAPWTEQKAWAMAAAALCHIWGLASAHSRVALPSASAKTPRQMKGDRASNDIIRDKIRTLFFPGGKSSCSSSWTDHWHARANLYLTRITASFLP